MADIEMLACLHDAILGYPELLHVVVVQNLLFHVVLALVDVARGHVLILLLLLRLVRCALRRR